MVAPLVLHSIHMVRIVQLRHTSLSLQTSSNIRLCATTTRNWGLECPQIFRLLMKHDRLIDDGNIIGMDSRDGEQLMNNTINCAAT